MALYYLDGSLFTENEITGYSYSPQVLTDNVTEITITYGAGGDAKTATLAVQVLPRLEKIEVTTVPTKTTYEYGESFSNSGVVITATYSNGTTENVNATYSPTDALSILGNQNITFSYTKTYSGYANEVVAVTKTCTQTILVERQTIEAIPSQKNIKEYTGSEITAEWNNYNAVELTISNITKATNAGTYIADFTPTANYRWSDGTTTAKSVEWIIEKQTVSTIPAQSGTLTYNGSNQNAAWSNYDSNKLTIGGTTSGTNAGTYTATFEPKANYRWPDGSITAKSVNWSIGQATPTLSVSPTSVSIDASNLTKTVTVIYNGDGALTVGSLTGVTTSISNKVVTITGNGSTAISNKTVAVSASAGTNYKAASVNITVNAAYWSWGTQTAVGDAAWWAGLKTWAASATASERSACVGKTKKVSLSTAVLGANQATMVCIGADQDGTGTLTFQTLGTLPTTTVFSSSSAAWIGSTARTQCQNFYNYCSAKASIKTVNKGTCPNINNSRDGAVTYTNETVWLPSEREMGLDSYSPISTANSITSKAECTKGYNAAYSYYNSNNRRIKYAMDVSGNVGTTAQYYWERSRVYDISGRVCSVRTGGTAGSNTYTYSYYLAPAYVIG